ncbi:hypothetical protein CAXC1_180058 [Candidatus Xenohaliotis californiensis]|uniref:Uncharacterized protein n=1 Tax=Candidatus Xenohaliotis californiensis TaxID=84677 RepID=A0ABM9N7K3_9RICK|nr:hypothetical protein CAXC1_180058 [Candidatus Xenohaliotis californiensis]
MLKFLTNTFLQVYYTPFIAGKINFSFIKNMCFNFLVYDLPSLLNISPL